MDHCREDLRCCIPLIRRFNDRPRCIIRICFPKHLFIHLLISCKFLISLQIALADSPLRFLRFHQLFEPLFLFFLIDRKKQFHNDHSVICKLLFKRTNRFIVCRQFFFRHFAVEPVDLYSAVPARIVDRNSSPLWCLRPETPHERVHPFLFRFFLNRMYLKSSRIQSLDQTSDLQAFSRSSVPFKGDHHRNFLFLAFPLQMPKLQLQRLHLLLVFFLAHFLC